MTETNTINLEREPLNRQRIRSLIYGRDEASRELRTHLNSYGYLYERYEDVLFGHDVPRAVEQFSEYARQLLEGSDGIDPAFRLATLTTCLDLSQAAGRIAERFDSRYHSTDLGEEELTGVIDSIREVVAAVPPGAALVDIVKEKITYIFDLYAEYPHLEVDVPMRDYETDILGPILVLDPVIANPDESLSTRFLEGQPTQVAQGLIGFRDTMDRIRLIAPIDQNDVEQRIIYSSKAYYELDPGYRDYLSGIYDYEQVVDRMQRQMFIEGLQPTELFLKDKPEQLFQEAQRPIVRAIIEESMGVSLKDVALENQFEFLRFCTSCSTDEYDRLSAIMLNLPESDRLGMFEAFLATEFGDDYGDSILTIAEHASLDQTTKIFETVNKFRDSSKRLASWYRSYDSQLAQDYERAMNERLTDALVALEVLVRDGELSVDVSPARNNQEYESDGRFELHIQSIDEGIAIVESLQKSLALQYDIITDPEVAIHNGVKNNQWFTIYRFSSPTHGDALMYARAEGGYGYDRQLEYGNYKGVEASLGFIVNPSDPHNIDLYKDPHGVSIRLDREGRTADESPFADDRDPTRSEGSISLDISSLMGDGRHMPVKIGRFIAAGNILRAAKVGGVESLHHNNNHFDQRKYGNSEGFAGLVRYMTNMVEVMIRLQKPVSQHDPSFDPNTPPIPRAA